ncbi:MAG: hypothetical protein ACQKBY_05245, partial [Verrucomicrobiales bacterium]
NHEYNFVAYHSKDKAGKFLRPHNEKNVKAHAATHAALPMDEIEAVWLPFLKILPFFLELDGFRVVHACWHPKHIEFLRHKTLGDHDFLIESSIKGTVAYEAVETVLKGVEITLPDPHRFLDHMGNKRRKIRARWWEKNPLAMTARNLLFPPVADFVNCPVDAHEVASLPGYAESEVPVFFGHYYKAADADKAPEKPNLYCLDFSAATDGPLTAYRWTGRETLKETQLRQTGLQSMEELMPSFIKFLKGMPPLGWEGTNAWDDLIITDCACIDFGCGMGEQVLDVYREWAAGHIESHLDPQALAEMWLWEMDEEDNPENLSSRREQAVDLVNKLISELLNTAERAAMAYENAMEEHEAAMEAGEDEEWDDHDDAPKPHNGWQVAIINHSDVPDLKAPIEYALPQIYLSQKDAQEEADKQNAIAKKEDGLFADTYVVIRAGTDD